MRRQVAIWGFIAMSCCGAEKAQHAEPSVAGSAAESPAQPVPASPSATATAASGLPAAIVSHFKTEDGRAAARAFALERFTEARDGFVRVTARAQDDHARARAQLMTGLCETKLRNWKAAAKNFESTIEHLDVIKDYIRYQAARSRYFTKDLSRSLLHAKAVSKDSIVGADAELLVGDILRARSTHDAVAAHYAAYLESRPHGIRRPEARYRLAKARVGQGQSAKAVPLLRKNTLLAPLSSWAKRSTELLAKLRNSEPALAATIDKPLTAAQLIERGMVYFNSMRNKESEQDFAAAITTGKLSSDAHCVAAFHRAQSVFKQRNRTKAAPLFDAAMLACKGTDNTDLKVKSAYQAGRSYANIRKRKVSLARYASAEKAAQGHSYADDARLRQAEEYRDLGDEKKVTEFLSSIPKLYPKGDMRAEALWRLAWRAYKNKDYEEALAWLSKQIAVMPRDSNYWAEGQAQYWSGRAHGELGNKDAALASYKNAVELYPLSYYALLSLNRLRELDAHAFREVMASIAPTPSDEAPPLSLARRAEYRSPGFARAIEFLRLGLGTSAEAELRKLGMSSPPGKKALTDENAIDRTWAMAHLYHSAGRFDHSSWVTRWHVTGYKQHWPRGKWRRHWDIAFPRGYWELLSRYSKKRGNPVELQIAFVREESGFDPLRESWANAIGLTQLIFPTARRFAKGTGITVSRATLRDPEKNVTIGSNFLSFLMTRFDGRVALTVPSYNAGEGATFRWLRMRGNWDQDAWAEEIPYDQARRYSKRVIASYFAYTFLRDGSVPKMPNSIPQHVLPGKYKRRRK